MISKVISKMISRMVSRMTPWMDQESLHLSVLALQNPSKVLILEDRFHNLYFFVCFDRFSILKAEICQNFGHQDLKNDLKGDLKDDLKDGLKDDPMDGSKYPSFIRFGVAECVKSVDIGRSIPQSLFFCLF